MTDNRDHILYFDDENENLELLAAQFEKFYKVSTTCKYAEALKILEQERIKVLLVDQRMPEISGIEFLKYVQEKYNDVVCIVISGYADKDLLFKVLNEAEVFGFVEKPWNKRELKLIIDNAIHKYNSRKETLRIQTELQIALDKARESERLKADFLASISHEIRTPVNGIVGFAELIKNTEIEEDLLHEYLGIISTSAYKLIGIVDDLITASHVKTGEVNLSEDVIYLNDLLEQLYTDFLPKVEMKPAVQFNVVKRTKNARIPITTDREKLFNIFNQLLKNAIKFTNEGCIEFGIADEDQQILFVKDTGCGIGESDKPLIFEYLTQGKQKQFSSEIDGIGVGLSIVKGLVSLMNGEIWFDSEPGEGTTFYFTVGNKHLNRNRKGLLDIAAQSKGNVDDMN